MHIMMHANTFLWIGVGILYPFRKTPLNTLCESPEKQRHFNEEQIQIHQDACMQLIMA